MIWWLVIGWVELPQRMISAWSVSSYIPPPEPVRGEAFGLPVISSLLVKTNCEFKNRNYVFYYFTIIFSGAHFRLNLKSHSVQEASFFHYLELIFGHLMFLRYGQPTHPHTSRFWYIFGMNFEHFARGSWIWMFQHQHGV